jgi:hypothetical protein
LVVDGQAGPAEQMLKRLSSFLRGGLAADPFDEIELGTEIEQQRLYLPIGSPSASTSRPVSKTRSSRP